MSRGSVRNERESLKRAVFLGRKPVFIIERNTGLEKREDEIKLLNLAAAKSLQFHLNRHFAELKTAPCQTTLPLLNRCSTLTCGNLAQLFRRRQTAESRHLQSKQDLRCERHPPCPMVTEVFFQSSLAFARRTRTTPKFSPIPIAGEPPKNLLQPRLSALHFQLFRLRFAVRDEFAEHSCSYFLCPKSLRKEVYRCYLSPQNC